MTRFLLAAISVSLLGLTSCSEAVGEVEGVVTLNGQPLPDGNIQFNPAKGGEPMVVLTDADGKYSMGGLKPGDYLVTVFVVDNSGDEQGQIIKKRAMGGAAKAAAPPPPTPANKPKIVIPDAFTKNDTTPVKPAIKGGKNKVDVSM